MRFVIISVLGLRLIYCSPCFSIDIPDSEDLRGNSRLEDLLFMPPKYREIALSLMIADANRTARELYLAEQLPINGATLVDFFVSPPRLARLTKTIGTITTSNYLYAPYAGKGYALVRANLQTEEARLRAEYLWPINRMDTNEAFQTAEQILAGARVAVSALNQNCQSQVLTCTPDGPKGHHFVPIYWVFWTEHQSHTNGNAAFVEIFEPTKMILQLKVGEPKYLHKEPLVITNVDFVFSQSNYINRTGPLAKP
jgi:hypothetical protein